MASNHPVTQHPPNAAELRFLDGGGEVGAALRAFDWAAHPLGQPEHWPSALKLTVSLCLHSSFPTAIYWGPEFHLLYNTAWTVGAGLHPFALGRPAGEARADIWPVIGPQFAQILQEGEGQSLVAQRLMMLRGGVPTETFWTYNSSPIRDENGVACGILNQGLDVTEQVQGEQALRRATHEREFMLSLAERQRMQTDPDDVMQLTAEAVGQYLGVDRAGFFQVIGGDVIHYGACWVGGVLPPLTGAVPSSVFGKDIGDAVRRGQTLAFSKPGDPGAPNGVALELTNTRAGVSVPLIRGGAWQGAFYLSHATARVWTPGEIALIEEVAELSWDAVARVRATARLHALNASLVGEVADRTAERDRLWEVSQDLLGIADPAGLWLAINPAWTRVLGWGATDIVGRTTDWLLHPDDVEKTHAEVAKLNAGETTLGFENRFRARDGGYRLLSWTATLVGARLYTTARDVTDERRQQAALLAAEERTRLVLEAMDGVSVWTYEVAADRFQADDSFARLYGFGPEDRARGVTLADLLGRVHPDDLVKMQSAILRVREGGTSGENEYRLMLPHGAVRRMMVRNHIVHGADGEIERVIGVAVDVTRQRELEDSLHQAQKMEAVGQLTGGLAHDFNNLLAGISGALEMMQVRLKQGRIGDLPRYIGAAQTGAGRAAALTHRLLAFSRRQPLDPRPVDVVQLVAGMEELVRGTLGPSVRVEIATESDSWPILADANQLENALLNLCINARDAMPAGGVVKIGTRNVWLDAATAAAQDLPEGAYLTLCVTDTGTGMTPEVIARAFDPFFTTKPMGQGTGLGLSMIYGFVRQSGGQIRIESTLGEGTMMCLYLPRHYGAAPRTADGGGDQALPVGSGETVLVVDDEPTVRMLVTEILGDLGYAAIEAETGAEALALLDQAGRIDLLVTDVGLPGGINGRQVADAAREKLPDLPVLFITGFAENAVVGDGPLDPGMALIAKPFAIETLAARVRALLGGG